MKRLMLDHYRRWWWVMALCAVLEFGLGWFIAAWPTSTFEFWAFLLSSWTGATLLSFDLKGGVLRPIVVLPLTGRQIGRSWWLATVPLPAIVLAALLFFGAAAFCRLHQPQIFPTQRLVLASLFTLVWLGIQFTMIFNAARGFGGNWREFIGNSLISWLSILVFFGSMLFCIDAARSPLKSTLLLGFGALLTVVGWVRAEQFEPGRAGLYLGRVEPPNLRRGGRGLRPLERKIPSSHYRVPGGCGAIRFLLSASFIRMFLYVAAMSALGALMWSWRGQEVPRPVAVVTFAGTWSLMSCGFIVGFQLLPVLRQLRFLRTLPIPATNLAAAMIAIATLPLIAVGALAAGVACLTLGTVAALTLLNSFAFVLAPASLCVFFAVWRGEGKLAYALLIVTLFGLQQVQLRLQMFLHVPELPFRLAGPMVATCVLLAFLLTRHVLIHSSHAYRIRANTSGNLPWGR